MSDRPTFEERIADPLSHFPYKHDEARTVAGHDELALAEVDATAAYVAAQEAYFLDPSEETRAAERAAADALREARQARRGAREQATADAAGDAPTDENTEA